VRRAWREERNPLRASVVSEPLFGRRNTGDNAPAPRSEPDLHEDLRRAGILADRPAAEGGHARIDQDPFGRRPICQDTGTAQIFMKVGLGARIVSNRSLQEIVDN
jgi:tartrate dehydratase alpha subunit/fumarate hydratase class I-like protein